MPSNQSPGYEAYAAAACQSSWTGWTIRNFSILFQQPHILEDQEGQGEHQPS